MNENRLHTQAKPVKSLTVVRYEKICSKSSSGKLFNANVSGLYYNTINIGT